jgi:hypothetical protein
MPANPSLSITIQTSSWQKLNNLSEKRTEAKRVRVVAQVVEHLYH